MSTFDYLAGASIERGINEAIRAQEERAHSAQLRALSERLQREIDELKRDNQDLRRLLELKNIHIGRQDAAIDRQSAEISAYKARINEADRELRISNLRAITYEQQLEVERAVQCIMKNEVGAFLGTSLNDVISNIHEQSGVSVSNEIKDYIKANAKIAIGFSSDPEIQNKFYRQFYDNLRAMKKEGKSFQNHEDMVGFAIKIANEVKEQHMACSKAESSETVDEAPSATRRMRGGV